MIRGKVHGPSIDVEQCASSPRQPGLPLSHISPGYSAVHAVLNGASLTFVWKMCNNRLALLKFIKFFLGAAAAVQHATPLHKYLYSYGQYHCR